MKPRTLFIDIDGTIFKHHTTLAEIERRPSELLPGSKEYIDRHYEAGDMIVLTTARPDYMFALTIQQLSKHQIKYHKLVMGLTSGYRLLINDSKGENHNTCGAVCVTRDKGIFLD